MQNIIEKISQKEAICLIAIFVMGSTLHFGIGGIALNDAWLGGILGYVLFLPFLLLYSKLLKDFPENNLFQIMEKVLGKWLGKIFTLLYIWYAFHLGALVIRNFTEYVKTVSLPETPLMVSTLCMGFVCIYAIKLGIEVLSRFSSYMLFIIITLIVVVQLLAIPLLRFENMEPFLGNGFKPIMQGALSAFSFPFAETILLMGVLDNRDRNTKAVNIYFLGVTLAMLFIVSLTIRNTLVLGAGASYYYFPAHVAVSRIALGEFIQRIEMTVSVVFLVCTFVKISVCLYVTCRGLMHLFNLNNYRPFVIQIGLLMSYFSYIVYDNIMQMRAFAFKTYQYYAFPFQVIIPLIIFIAAIIYHKRKNNHAESGKS